MVRLVYRGKYRLDYGRSNRWKARSLANVENAGMMVVTGRMKAGQVKTISGNKLRRLEFLDPTESDDQISIKIVAEVE